MNATITYEDLITTNISPRCLRSSSVTDVWETGHHGNAPKNERTTFVCGVILNSSGDLLCVTAWSEIPSMATLARLFASRCVCLFLWARRAVTGFFLEPRGGGQSRRLSRSVVARERVKEGGAAGQHILRGFEHWPKQLPSARPSFSSRQAELTHLTGLQPWIQAEKIHYNSHSAFTAGGFSVNMSI